MTRHSFRLAVAASSLLLATFAAVRVSVAQAPTLKYTSEQEIKFAMRLAEMGLADYAGKVVDRLKKKDPSVASKVVTVETSILLNRGKVAQVLEILKGLPERSPAALTIRKQLAVAYYSRGKLFKAVEQFKIYFSIMSEPPADIDDREEYKDNAFIYAQLLEKAGMFPEAVDAFGLVLAALGPDDKQLASHLEMLQVELLIRGAELAAEDKKGELLDRADKTCSKLEWYGADIRSKASALRAWILLVRGDLETADKKVGNAWEEIARIDAEYAKQGQRTHSPLVYGRYVRGRIAEANGDALALQDPDRAKGFYADALSQYVTVYCRFAEHKLAADATRATTELLKKIEALTGRRPKLPPCGGSSCDQLFKDAGELFMQEKYAEAVDKYVSALNECPEARDPSDGRNLSVTALDRLLSTYMKTDDRLMVKATASYLAERFSSDDAAANAVLKAANEYFKANLANPDAAAPASTNAGPDFALSDGDLYDYLFQQVAINFPKHDSIGQVLYLLGDNRMRDGDEDGALAYYTKIIRRRGDKYYLPALSRIGFIYYKRQAYKSASNAYTAYLKSAPASQEKARIKGNLAYSQVKLEEYDAALKHYAELREWLSPETDPYTPDPEAEERNAIILQQASYFSANIYDRQAKLPEAIEGYRNFIKEYKQSELAPVAMMGLGSVYVRLASAATEEEEKQKYTTKAADAFEELQRSFPDSEFAKNSSYFLTKALLETGDPGAAKSAYQGMLKIANSFSPEKFLVLGHLFVKAEDYESAFKAFDQVLTRAENPKLMQRTYFNLGKIHLNLGNCDQAVISISKLFEQFPKTGYFFDASFILADAYVCLDRYPKAVTALTEALNKATKTVTRVRCDLALGDLAEKQKKPVEAAAAYDRIVRYVASTGPTDPANPYLAEALLRAARVMTELSRWQDGYNYAVKYIETYPKKRREVAEAQRLKVRCAQNGAVDGGAAPPPGAAVPDGPGDEPGDEPDDEPGDEPGDDPGDEPEPTDAASADTDGEVKSPAEGDNVDEPGKPSPEAGAGDAPDAK